MKPFLKWAGGKTQLLDKINEELPRDIDNYKRYIEPFIGAGAVFFNLINNDRFEEYIINDINEKLINLYKIIRDNVDEFICEIEMLREEYLKSNTEEKSELFYDIRSKFNTEKNDNMKLAVYFLFLNKTAFNGLYRENSKGEFNVPWGKYENPSFFDESQIREISRLLNLKNNKNENRVKILNCRFEELEEYIDSNTFVYMDPPYRPVTKGGFNSYNKSSFNDDSQIKLAEFYRRIDLKGAKLMLSNSDPKNLDEEDEFFDELYNGFNIQRIYAKRSINSNGAGRGNITELLITNYFNEGDEVIVELRKKSYQELQEEELVKIFTSSLLETNRAFNFYVNWNRPGKVIEKFNIELNILNALVRSKNYDEDFKKILKKVPTAVNVFPALFALSLDERNSLITGKSVLKIVNTSDFEENTSMRAIEDDLLKYRFDIKDDEQLSDEDIEKYLEFTKKMGLKYLFTDLLEKHLVDYVIGCEVGLDSNARKNRGGMAFELALEPIVEELAEKYDIEVLKQKKFKELRKYGFEITKDIESRKADFILLKDKKAMNIEVNFFGGAGSKPEEIIDSYINRQGDLLENNLEFVLVTDGQICWGNEEKPQLLKGFRHLKHLLNYNMAKNGFMEDIIKNIF